MAVFSAAAAKAAAALKAQAEKAAAQQKAAAQVKQALGSAARGMTVGAAAPKPAPQIQANIPPAIRGAQGNDMIMSPRAGATTGGPKPAPVSAYNPKEGVGVTAATPRPLAGQGNDMMMGSPATGGIAPATPRPVAAATGPMTPVRGGGMAPASVATMMKKGGRVKAKAKSSYSSGGKVSSASKRADGIATKGKTKGRMV